uniref:Subtilisin-like protease SBT1.8 n=1 Tax=Tanacetum cinerariifolium TaxID=118510 RepID=A0A6L2ME99_TANCI|nr:subtilisin-like protease SBT1.8 [Tanacetum cinerariifolium]
MMLMISSLSTQKKEEEEKQITKEQATKAQYWKIPIFYDDDEDYTIAITLKEPKDSLRVRDEHLNTIPEKESDGFIKSSVEDLVPNPKTSIGTHGPLVSRTFSLRRKFAWRSISRNNDDLRCTIDSWMEHVGDEDGYDFESYTFFPKMMDLHIMGEPLSLDHVFDFPVDEPEPHPAYDFFAPRPLLGYAANEPMVGPMVDEIVEPIVEVEEQMITPVVGMDEDITMLFGDDDFERLNEEFREVNKEWLMALVTPPLMPAVPPPSVYEVGGPSTAAAVTKGQSFPVPALGLPIPSSVIEDFLYLHRTNFSAGPTQHHSSGNTSSLALAKYTNSGIFITGSENDLSILFPTISLYAEITYSCFHGFVDKDLINLVIPDVRSTNFSAGPTQHHSSGNTSSLALAKYTNTSLDNAQIKEVKKLDSVLGVYEDEVYHLHTTRTPEFLGIENDVLDTGVWPESRSFDDGDMPGVPGRWKGVCEEGEDFKVGNASLFGFANGTARRMVFYTRVATYKVCWKTGCFGSDILAGMDRAILDVVDVLSMSLGEGSEPYHRDIIVIDVFKAMEIGVFVSCSAWNSGPTKPSLANIAPWIMTVGAGT